MTEAEVWKRRTVGFFILGLSTCNWSHAGDSKADERIPLVRPD